MGLAAEPRARVPDLPPTMNVPTGAVALSSTSFARPRHTIADCSDEGAWDQALPLLEGATFCHLAAWRDVLSDELGHEPFYRAARAEDGTIEGLLPLFRVRSRLMGDRLYSVPHMNYGGPVGTHEARAGLENWILELAGSIPSIKRIESRGLVPPTGALSPDNRKVTVLLDLPEDSETLWNDGLRSKTRTKVRRPLKEGWEFRQGPGEVAAFYEVFAQNMRDLGTPVLPLRFFERLLRAFPQEVVVGSVWAENRPVAGGFGFHWQEEYEMTWSSSLREYNRLSPNMLLYWRTMEAVIQRGARRFNFGRCSPGSSTHTFKLQWGGFDVDLPWGVWSPGTDVDAPYTESRALMLASSWWQRLPVSVATRAGPWFARQLP